MRRKRAGKYFKGKTAMSNFTRSKGKSEAKVQPRDLSVRNHKHRYNPGFSPEKTLYVFHQVFGKVLEFSISELLFLYQYDQNDKEIWHEEIPDTGVLFPSWEDYIYGIPFTIVYDRPVSPPNWWGSFVLRQRRIAFGCLTENQTERIERLLLSHVV
jgi:hypothetical protein